MMKDDMINDYIYNMPPASFQYARYTDWFHDYIDGQKQDNEKVGQNTMTTSSYIQGKIAQTTACMNKFQLWAEKRVTELKLKEDMQIKTKLANEEEYKDSILEQNWMIDHPEIIKHWPP